MTPIYTVIPCLDRQEYLKNLLDAINQPVGNVIIVDTGTVPPLSTDPDLAGRATFIYLPLDSPRNIQTWWNVGISRARLVSLRRKEQDFHVAVLNSDLDIDRGVIEMLSLAISVTDAAIASPDRSGELDEREVRLEFRQEPTSFGYRMMGYCWVMRGSAELELDEGFVWWYGDDDIEWRARVNGGVARVGGLKALNLDESSARMSEETKKQVVRDSGRFLTKWATYPCL